MVLGVSPGGESAELNDDSKLMEPRAVWQPVAGGLDSTVAVAAVAAAASPESAIARVWAGRVWGRSIG